MKNFIQLKYEQGVSLVGLMIWIIILAITIIYGSQIGLAYVTQYTIKKAVSATFNDIKTEDTITIPKIKKMLLRKLQPDDIDIKEDDIDVLKEDKSYTIVVSHFKQIKINDKMTLNIDLSFEQTSN